MTREQIRDQLRREIQDTESVEWTNAELDAIINQAYALVQKEVVKQAGPEAHLFWDYLDLDANVSWYPLPPTFSVQQVGLKDPQTGEYYEIKPKGYRDIGPRTVWSGAVQVPVGDTTQTYYTIRGQWLGIFPKPAASIVKGIEVLHCPIMSIASGDDGDGDSPRTKEPTHLAILLWSKLIALGDTDETTMETRTRLQEMLGDLSSWYNLHGDGGDKFQVSR